MRTERGFLRLSLVALALLWVIVPSGAIVRLTGSGLGCPDWPLCDGGVVPASAGHELIEYGNRVLSAVVFAVAVLTWLAARGLPRSARGPRRWSAVIAAATAGQIPLGAVTVLSGLHPLSVGAHFLLSMVALAAGTLLALSARDRARGVARATDRRRGPLAIAVGVAMAAMLVTGVLVTAAGPHSGDDDVTNRFGDLLVAAKVHVRAAFAFTALVVVLAAWVWREGGVDRLTRRLSALALVLIAVQIGLGEYQWRNGLPWEVVVLHVTVAAALWSVTVAACAGVVRPAVAAEAYRRRDAAVWQGTQRIASGSALSRPSGISPPQSTQIP